MRIVFSFLMLVFLVINSMYGQEHVKKFQFEFGYGLSFSGDFSKNEVYESKALKFGTPLIGKNIEATVKYVFPNKRFIGLGITVQSYVNKLDGIDQFNSQAVLAYKNYRLEEELQYYELQYGKFFDNGLDLTLSLFWINYYLPLADTVGFNGSSIVQLRHFESLPDDFGLALGLGCCVYKNTDINISIRAKAAVTFNGLEAVTLTPLVRFNF